MADSARSAAKDARNRGAAEPGSAAGIGLFMGSKFEGLVGRWLCEGIWRRGVWLRCMASLHTGVWRGRSTGRSAAVGADAGQFCLVFDLLEAVLGGDATTPVRERAVVQFDDLAATPAGQVVVVPGRTGAVGGFAAGTADRVDLALVGEPAEVAVHGRQADAGIGGTQSLVKFLSRKRSVALDERVKNRLPLLGSPGFGYSAPLITTGVADSGRFRLIEISGFSAHDSNNRSENDYQFY